MKIPVILGVLFAACVISAVTFAESGRRPVPAVAYLVPDDDSVVDLTGKDFLVFKWKAQAIPTGGRSAFKFTLYIPLKDVLFRKINCASFSISLENF